MNLNTKIEWIKTQLQLPRCSETTLSLSPLDFDFFHIQEITYDDAMTGIAIAIGAMVDAAIVMIENAHKHIEKWRHAHPKQKMLPDEHWNLIAEAASEVGPALFFSLLIITLSFIPVFTLEAQEGRLFAPLAFTKTYAMAAAGLSITIVPVLMGYFIRGWIPSEKVNPISKAAFYAMWS
jgi:Cu(I)/Ag(I) efflux system membrane protein CusA/SilA